MTYAYEHIPDLFEISTWDEDIRARFGLRSSGWHDFRKRINELQSACAENERIKVLYAARHGEAEHNTLYLRYGMPDTDEVQLRYPITDPGLTPAGREQAMNLAQVLRQESSMGMPLPTRWYTSPMRRPGETVGLTWGWLYGKGESDLHAEGILKRGADMSHGVRAEVVEQIREHLHVHHCDERLAKSELMKLFPAFMWPTSMPEKDTVWRPTGRETEDEMIARAAEGLTIIMDSARDDVYISMTAHSGVLRALYKTLGVPAHRLDTGEMNVLVLRVRNE
ncbi:hypothetical protein CspeluHIS016_0902110 [Cutaneotrichosporon spelunceum]|uniref:Phosphoglycerate mutase-like protein n=1 Tax=Cutaneotrichosporon spelunceum TaxID=1672016 RepID=A0AAD3YFD6_9TREE|nr:hypothetical protein CspeluHIS016_0902110 [Cutaneotrichosporon spelunceum]